MRLAYERYASEQGYSPAQFRAVAEEVSGASLEAFFRHHVDGTEELDYADALAYFGLRFEESEEQGEDEDEDEDETPAFLGIETHTRDRGKLMVSVVRRGTPAHRAGVNADDELLAIDGYRVPPAGLSSRLERYRARGRGAAEVAIPAAWLEELRALGYAE